LIIVALNPKATTGNMGLIMQCAHLDPGWTHRDRDGQTLAELVAGRPLPLEQVLDLGSKIADAPEAYAEGIILGLPLTDLTINCARLLLCAIGYAILR
jgi:hypothetical protein